MAGIEKDEFVVCQGVLCWNNYIVPIQGLCFDSLSACLCFASDCSLLSKNEGNVSFCTLLPGCAIYPTVGCCKSPNDHGWEGASDMDSRKADAIALSGCCFFIGQTSCYLIKPDTCCHTEFQRCLCLGGDCAFPCVETVPTTCTCLPCCTIFPRVGCCLKVGDLAKTGGKA